MIDTNLKEKIIDNFNGSLKSIRDDLLQLEENIRNKEKLDIKTRGRILDSTYILEVAVFRATIYGMQTDLGMIKKELQILNTTLNKIANKYNHEFLRIMNFKIISLLTFTIDYC